MSRVNTTERSRIERNFHWLTMLLAHPKTDRNKSEKKNEKRRDVNAHKLLFHSRCSSRRARFQRISLFCVRQTLRGSFDLVDLVSPADEELGIGRREREREKAAKMRPITSQLRFKCIFKSAAFSLLCPTGCRAFASLANKTASEKVQFSRKGIFLCFQSLCPPSSGSAAIYHCSAGINRT